MPIGEKRFAGEIMFIGGEAMKFDDLGCLVAFHYGVDSTTTHGVFVIDYDGGGWIPEEDAYVLLHGAIETPMGSNTIAFRNRSDAVEAKRRYGGEIVSLQELLKRETIIVDSSSTRYKPAGSPLVD